MATTYRFIVEQSLAQQQSQQNANGVNQPLIGAGSAYSGSNKGVEHNRYLRAINPILNKYTGGQWEKGVRLTRASIGVGNMAMSGGLASALTSVGFIIILQEVFRQIDKYINNELKKAKEDNQANYLRIKTGDLVLGREYTASKNFWGKVSYKNQ